MACQGAVVDIDISTTLTQPQTTDNVTFFLFSAPFYRSLRSHWDSAAEPAKPPVPGLNFLTLLGLFYSVVPCALSLKGALKIKKKLEQPVSSHCISNTLFHVVCCCLFILVCRIYIDVLNIENLLIYPLHKLSCNVCKASQYLPIVSVNKC